MVLPRIHTIHSSSDLGRKNPQVAVIQITPTDDPPSPRERELPINSHTRRYGISRKPSYFIEQTMADMSRRLTIRKFLQTRLTIVSDLMCSLSTLSIVLMIIANELTFDRLNDRDTKNSWSIKVFITISTIILLGLLLYYHYLDIKLYSNQNSLQDHRVGLTYRKICLIIFELIICAIHPIPRTYPEIDPPIAYSNSTISLYTLSYTAIDVGLGIPMFLRLYLFGRSILFHSRLVRNASLRSFGYLNRVSIDFFFLIKTALEQWPGRCLFTFCTVVFFIGSWSLRACEHRADNLHMPMSDAMWLFIVTFTTIGYGDLYPASYCGRSIVTITGLVGLLSSALLIAVLAQKLLLTRQEKYVHTFVLNTQLVKQHHHHAANIVKFAIKIWLLKRRNTSSSKISYIKMQRKLFRSISSLQQTKREQKSLIDNCVGLHELMSLQQNINMQYEQSTLQMINMENHMKKIEEQIKLLTRNTHVLQSSLHDLSDQLRKRMDVDKLAVF